MDTLGAAPLVIVLVLLLIFVAITVVRAVRIVPQASALIVERLGRYSRTLEAGLHVLVPFVDRVRARVDLREQVVSFPPQPVITSDNLVVSIDTVIYYQPTDPRAATYEIANYIQGIEQLTVTTSDKSLPAINLPVEGRVAPPLSISPSPLLFGTLAPGHSATRQLVITGKQPFKLLSVASEPAGLQFRAATGIVKKVHLVPVTITAGDQFGDRAFVITVETDLPQGGKGTCQVRASVGSGGPLEATAVGASNLPRPR